MLCQITVLKNSVEKLAHLLKKKSYLILAFVSEYQAALFTPKVLSPKNNEFAPISVPFLSIQQTAL